MDSWVHPLRTAIQERFFQDGRATSDLLSTIAGSIITVTSITFSLLLLAAQQAASALSHQVYDQFLRRRVNQVYFGFFVGLAVYTLLILASADSPYNPVFGASLAVCLTILALLMMIILLYTPINQVRPAVVIDAIHERILLARDAQLKWVNTTMSRSEQVAYASAVASDRNGYVVEIDVEAIRAIVPRVDPHTATVLLKSVGAYVAYEDPLVGFCKLPVLTDADAELIRNACLRC